MCSNQALNDCVLFWFRQKLSQGVPVDGLMIIEKVLRPKNWALTWSLLQLVTEEEEDEEDEDEELDEDNGTPVAKIVSVHSTLKAADELQAYLDMHGDDCHQESLLLLQIKCLITEKLITAPKQSKITNFFSRNKS